MGTALENEPVLSNVPVVFVVQLLSGVATLLAVSKV
jgi:hypothetical protein